MINEFLKSEDGKALNKLNRASCTYNALYLYWREQLFERVMRLFVWSGNGDILPKEIEQRLIINGHCGIAQLPKENDLTAFYGSFSGVSKYYDEKPYYIVRCPIYSGQKTIDKDVVVINNNAIRNPIYPLIHHYAMLLAHTEVTYMDIVINSRDAEGVPVVSTEKQKQSVTEYQRKRFNGEYGVVTDLGSLGVTYAGINKNGSQSAKEVYEVRSKILKDFYADIGVRSSFEKRSNTVVEEVEADTSLLLLNISDMLDARKRGCERVNNLFGTNWSVEVNEEINYREDNTNEEMDNRTASEESAAE